jgi:hypothetical protein
MVFDLCLVSTVTVRFLEKGQWFQLRLLPNFHQGQVVWLKDFGFVQLFKTQLKEQQRFYIVHQDEDDLLSFEGFMNYIQVIGK